MSEERTQLQTCSSRNLNIATDPPYPELLKKLYQTASTDTLDYPPEAEEQNERLPLVSRGEFHNALGEV